MQKRQGRLDKRGKQKEQRQEKARIQASLPGCQEQKRQSWLKRHAQKIVVEAKRKRCVEERERRKRQVEQVLQLLAARPQDDEGGEQEEEEEEQEQEQAEGGFGRWAGFVTQMGLLSPTSWARSRAT